MAPLTSDAIATAPTDDAFGINNVSGYYGPGAWAAWYLTLLTSWVALVVNSRSHNWYFVAYLLYINCAAVDLWCQTEEASETNTQLYHSGPIAAALTVVSWGTLHAMSQIVYTTSRCEGLMKDRSRGHEQFRHLRGRRIVLSIGTILPLCAGLVTFGRLLRNNFLTSDHSSPTSGAHDISRHSFLTFRWHGLGMAPGSSILDTVLLAAEVLSTFLILGAALVPFYRYSLRTYVASQTLAFATNLYAFTAIGPAIIMLSCSIFGWLILDVPHMDPSTIFKPQAPQSISEMDQAFTLFVALAMAAYELMPTIRKLKCTTWPSLSTAIRATLQTRFYTKRRSSYGVWPTGENVGLLGGEDGQYGLQLETFQDRVELLSGPWRGILMGRPFEDPARLPGLEDVGTWYDSSEE
ncbi:hypothetical protein EK21DRAFT_111908 [Setomelanomma holmii]|uniref:Uncharacterized protein n=1 Tax=Setomelanomma holmii TaxID=210430 RepID=A0A9P4H8S9_9PLEO|nr:hypothetical protein EK21DRAFT_111908 [Setomelanomma holmii]